MSATLTRRIRREPLRWRTGSDITVRVPVRTVDVEIKETLEKSREAVRSAWSAAELLHATITPAALLS